MWNERDTPIAYFISFRCYGTWLHGDERGSIVRFNNIYGTPKIPSNIHWESISSARMKHEPVYLNGAMRRSVNNAIIETCAKRDWYLYALNVRTNHAHSVVANPGKKPDFILSALKANATRKMREDGCWGFDHSPWAEKGSKRWLWTERAVANAADYVINRQGTPLPDMFD